MQQPAHSERYSFYAFADAGHFTGPRGLIAPGYRCVVWRPQWWRVLPVCMLPARKADRQLRVQHLIFYWVHHFLHGTGREYQVYLVFSGKVLVHYSVVRSRDYRFPFMGSADIQVGPAWTHPNHRGLGLASNILTSIQARWATLKPRVWWICSERNIPSNAIAGKRGFALVGNGIRHRKFGLRVFGSFLLRELPKTSKSCCDFSAITEQPGDGASYIQLQRLVTRYSWAAEHSRGKDVLEVACGCGLGLGLISKAARSLTGCDIDQSNLAIARATYAGRNSIRLEHADAQHLPFPAHSFDVVMVFEAIYYFADQRAFFTQAKRVLKPGGTLLLTTVNPEWRGFTPSRHSTTYWNARTIYRELSEQGFVGSLYGSSPEETSLYGNLVSHIRGLAIRLELVPATLRARQVYKRMFYGRLCQMPREVEDGLATAVHHVSLSPTDCAAEYSTLFASGTLP